MTGSKKLLELLESGELSRLAKSCKSSPELYKLVGMTEYSYRAARTRLRKRGIEIPGDSELFGDIPSGHMVRGVSTLRDGKGNLRAQWIKTSISNEQHTEALIQAFREEAKSWGGVADPAPTPAVTPRDDLLSVYVIGDAHFGLYTWAEECGESFDTDLAEKITVEAIRQLSTLAPPSSRALIVSVGDLAHADNVAGTTVAGTRLDVDTRWLRVMRIVVKALRRCVDLALRRHDTVEVFLAQGNHDSHASLMLAMALEQFYEREPRVKIDTTPSRLHYYRFGANLIGVTHGDTIKLDRLPGIMACDRAADWGATTHRRWYTGHVHHDQLKEYPGVIVETCRTLAARDAWHTNSGYRSGRDMKLDVLHKEFGHTNRHIVGIERVKSKI